MITNKFSISFYGFPVSLEENTTNILDRNKIKKKKKKEESFEDYTSLLDSRLKMSVDLFRQDFYFSQFP